MVVSVRVFLIPSGPIMVLLETDLLVPPRPLEILLLLLLEKLLNWPRPPNESPKGSEPRPPEKKGSEKGSLIIIPIISTRYQIEVRDVDEKR